MEEENNKKNRIRFLILFVGILISGGLLWFLWQPYLHASGADRPDYLTGRNTRITVFDDRSGTWTAPEEKSGNGESVMIEDQKTPKAVSPFPVNDSRSAENRARDKIKTVFLISFSVLAFSVLTWVLTGRKEIGKRKFRKPW